MARLHFVCSDVHLGLPASESEFFYKTFIPEIRQGDTLILLGDILDYWISAKDIQLRTVIDNWRDLHECLRGLRMDGVNIEYIPGNHDSFVFYTECGDVADFYWSDWLFGMCEAFRTLRDETREFRLSRLCDIHYPFFKKVIGSRTGLFTHGHWIDLAWRILAGDVDGVIEGWRLAKFWIVAKALNACLVHKYAPEIRRMFNQYLDHDDIFELTRRAEDISYCILAEILSGETATGWDDGGEDAGVGPVGPGETTLREAYGAMARAFEEELRGRGTRDRRGLQRERQETPRRMDA